jgi:hypothetical protein
MSRSGRSWSAIPIKGSKWQDSSIRRLDPVPPYFLSLTLSLSAPRTLPRRVVNPSPEVSPYRVVYLLQARMGNPITENKGVTFQF